MILQDLKYAMRSLRHRPGFTAAIALTLGLAIGANATIFSWIDALALDPLPGVPRASELVLVRFATQTRDGLSFSYPNYRDVRDSRPEGLAGLAVHDMMPVAMRADAAPERVWAQLVSGNLFDVLQVDAAHGRMLQPADEAGAGQSFVTVVSDRLWRTRFASDPAMVGRAIGLNGQTFTVVGVAPPGFQGAMNGLAMDLWVPVTMQGVLSGRSTLESRGSGWLVAIGRKRPGVPDGQLEAELRVIAARLHRQRALDPLATAVQQERGHGHLGAVGFWRLHDGDAVGRELRPAGLPHRCEVGVLVLERHDRLAIVAASLDVLDVRVPAR